MAFMYKCGGCGKVYEASANMSGQKTTCHHCGTAIEVPEVVRPQKNPWKLSESKCKSCGRTLQNCSAQCMYCGTSIVDMNDVDSEQSQDINNDIIEHVSKTTSNFSSSGLMYRLFLLGAVVTTVALSYLAYIANIAIIFPSLLVHFFCLYYIAGGVYDLESVMEYKKHKIALMLFSRKFARIYYVVLGLTIILLNFYFVTSGIHNLQPKEIANETEARKLLFNISFAQKQYKSVNNKYATSVSELVQKDFLHDKRLFYFKDNQSKVKIYGYIFIQTGVWDGKRYSLRCYPEEPKSEARSFTIDQTDQILLYE